MSARNDREVMTPGDVAKRLGVAVGKVLTWINAGELVALNLATSKSNRPRWVIQREALEAFLNSRRSVPDSEVAKSRSVARKNRHIVGPRRYF